MAHRISDPKHSTGDNGGGGTGNTPDPGNGGGSPGGNPGPGNGGGNPGWSPGGGGDYGGEGELPPPNGIIEIPEPPTLMLLALGFAATLVRGARSHRAGGQSCARQSLHPFCLVCDWPFGSRQAHAGRYGIPEYQFLADA